MAEQPTERRYGSFPRRLRAAVVDGAVLLIILLLTLIGVEVTGSSAAFILGIAVIALYDPVLVSTRGQTVGHRLMGLSVAEESHDARINFPRALARSVLKTVLGIPSFLLMAVTRRHQAIHDRVTKSVVVRSSRVGHAPADFHSERSDSQLLANVSVPRRIVAIVLYSVIGFLVAALAYVPLTSEACLVYDDCSVRDDLVNVVLGVIWLMALGTIMILGWRGRLPGARSQNTTDRNAAD